MRSDVATLLLLCGDFALWLIPNQSLWILTSATLNGFFNCAFVLTAFSMRTGTVAYHRARTGLNRAGALNGVRLESAKLAFAVGTLIIGLVLSASGADRHGDQPITA